MWENVVGPALEDINPKLNPKTASETDELLATEIGMYVCPPEFSQSTRIICCWGLKTFLFVQQEEKERSSKVPTNIVMH